MVLIENIQVIWLFLHYSLVILLFKIMITLYHRSKIYNQIYKWNLQSKLKSQTIKTDGQYFDLVSAFILQNTMYCLQITTQKRRLVINLLVIIFKAVMHTPQMLLQCWIILEYLSTNHTRCTLFHLTGMSHTKMTFGILWSCKRLTTDQTLILSCNIGICNQLLILGQESHKIKVFFIPYMKNSNSENI